MKNEQILASILVTSTIMSAFATPAAINKFHCAQLAKTTHPFILILAFTDESCWYPYFAHKKRYLNLTLNADKKLFDFRHYDPTPRGSHATYPCQVMYFFRGYSASTSPLIVKDGV